MTSPNTGTAHDILRPFKNRFKPMMSFFQHQTSATFLNENSAFQYIDEEEPINVDLIESIENSLMQPSLTSQRLTLESQKSFCASREEIKPIIDKIKKS